MCRPSFSLHDAPCVPQGAEPGEAAEVRRPVRLPAGRVHRGGGSTPPRSVPNLPTPTPRVHLLTPRRAPRLLERFAGSGDPPHVYPAPGRDPRSEPRGNSTRDGAPPPPPPCRCAHPPPAPAAPAKRSRSPSPSLASRAWAPTLQSEGKPRCGPACIRVVLSFVIRFVSSALSPACSKHSKSKSGGRGGGGPAGVPSHRCHQHTTGTDKHDRRSAFFARNRLIPRLRPPSYTPPRRPGRDAADERARGRPQVSLEGGAHLAVAALLSAAVTSHQLPAPPTEEGGGGGCGAAGGFAASTHAARSGFGGRKCAAASSSPCGGGGNAIGAAGRTCQRPGGERPSRQGRAGRTERRKSTSAQRSPLQSGWWSSWPPQLPLAPSSSVDAASVRLPRSAATPPTVPTATRKPRAHSRRTNTCRARPGRATHVVTSSEARHTPDDKHETSSAARKLNARLHDVFVAHSHERHEPTPGLQPPLQHHLRRRGRAGGRSQLPLQGGRPWGSRGKERGGGAPAA